MEAIACFLIKFVCFLFSCTILLRFPGFNKCHTKEMFVDCLIKKILLDRVMLEFWGSYFGCLNRLQKCPEYSTGMIERSNGF